MIIAAAIKLSDGSVFTGKRHHHCISNCSEFYFPNHTWNATPENYAKWRSLKADDDQGFVTHTGEYVSREEALIIATKYQQIIPDSDPRKVLYSEDLY